MSAIVHELHTRVAALQKEKEEIYKQLIVWLYYKLLDYMSGSGSTEDDDRQMAAIGKLIEGWKK